MKVEEMPAPAKIRNAQRDSVRTITPSSSRRVQTKSQLITARSRTPLAFKPRSRNDDSKLCGALKAQTNYVLWSLTPDS